MNNNPNNPSGLPPKQINRVVTPIRVDSNGNKIIEVKPEINEELEKTEPLEVIKEEQKKKKPIDSSMLIFIIAIIIILDILAAFICFIIIPRYEENKKRIPFNDATTTTTKRIDIISED